MPGSFSELIVLMPSIGATVLTAIAVKWLDDCIDEKHPTNSVRSGAAYSLLAILVAAILDLPLTIALFSACYVIGMFTSMTQKLPSGLPGWLESMLILIFAAVYCGLAATFWSVLVIYSVQLLDDLLDYRLDEQQNRSNVVNDLGVERTIILFSFCFYISVAIEPFLSVLVLSSALIVANTLFGRQKGGTLYARTDHG
ncbi:MAG TPA: hypothetical protein GX739_06200 [Firmicutes bacterium]|nr:hypothetical protein [Bacillota bacterium]